MRTDWAVLKCALFHVAYNSVKHGKCRSVVKVKATAGEEGQIHIKVKNSLERETNLNWHKLNAGQFSLQSVFGGKGLTQSAGIGISTSKRLAQALGGHFYVEPNTGKDQVKSVFVLPSMDAYQLSNPNSSLMSAVGGSLLRPQNRNSIGELNEASRSL